MRSDISEEIGAESLSIHLDQQFVAELEELRRRFEKLAQRFGLRSGQVTPEEVHSVIAARALRFNLFPADLFADPAWDMLVHLYVSELEDQRVAVSKLCVASGVPGTTALRHIGHLERRGLTTRRPDPLDNRRAWVELSPTGSVTMRKYFQALRSAMQR